MKNQDRYKTLLVIVVGLLVISKILEKKYGIDPTTLIYVAIGIGFLSILSSFFAKWIEWAWLKLALGLGWINSRILLTVIYFIFLLPIAWLSRLFTNDPLKLKTKNEPSLYLTRDHLYKKEDLENIW